MTARHPNSRLQLATNLVAVLLRTVVTGTGFSNTSTCNTNTLPSDRSGTCSQSLATRDNATALPPANDSCQESCDICRTVLGFLENVNLTNAPQKPPMPGKVSDLNVLPAVCLMRKA